MCNRKRNLTRNEREARIWAWVRLALLALLGILIALLIMGAGEEPEPTSVAERRAQFVAQERYYEVIDRYGDVEGAAQAAELVYQDMMRGNP